LIIDASSGEILVSTRAGLEEATATGLSSFLSTSPARTLPLLNDPLLAPNNLILITLVPVALEGETAPSHLLGGINSGVELAQLMQQLRGALEDSPLAELRSRVTYFMVEPDWIIRLTADGAIPEAVEQSENTIFRLTEPGVSQLLGFWDPTPLRRQAAIEWIQDWPLATVVDVSEDEVFSDLIGLGIFTAVLVTAAAVVTILVVVTSANQFLQPVNDMAKFAQRFSMGDWSQRVPVERDDELGAVAGALNRMAEDLSGLYRQLESRVEERTRQIRTAAEVARAVIMTPDLDDLLRRSVELIRERFGYDYVAVFLIDKAGANAMLSEATGDVGAKLKGQRYSLVVGSPSIIGWVASTNRPRMIPEVRREPAQPREDLLPQSRSEAAVPLQVAGRVLGVLDVQSSAANAFAAQDLEVLQTLADQLSAALQHARLIQTSVAAAERARVISQVTSQISGYLDVGKVLQTAALAIHRSLGNPEVAVKLVSPEEVSGAPSGSPEGAPEPPEDLAPGA
jgi:putative methionine-R-sulfoxide reductase with GAF domain